MAEAVAPPVRYPATGAHVVSCWEIDLCVTTLPSSARFHAEKIDSCVSVLGRTRWLLTILHVTVGTVSVSNRSGDLVAYLVKVLAAACAFHPLSGMNHLQFVFRRYCKQE